MINILFDLSRIQQVPSGCKELTKKRIRHKPGLGLLHKFILSADGAHVFLILPPEFQVCQRRSGAAKVFFCQEQNEPELFGRSRIGLFLSTSVSYLPPSPFPSDQPETATFIQCTQGKWGIQPATPRKHIFKQERFS